VRRGGFVCGTAALVAMLASGCGGGARREERPAPRPEPVPVPVARAGGNVISRAELEHWASVAAADRIATRRQALSFLIDSMWLTVEARELAVAVRPSEVKHQVAELTADRAENVVYGPLPHDPTLRRLLLAAGLRTHDRERLMKLALLMPKVERARLQRARRAVPRALVKRFYMRHWRRFFLPDQRQVEIIGSSQSAVLQAKDEIERGASFLEVARRVSIDPEAPGGLWRLLRGHDEPQVERPVFAAKPHVLVGPEHYSEYYIFEVLEAIPAHQQSLAQVEETIRRELAPSPRRLASTAERRWRARTVCFGTNDVPQCGRRRTGRTPRRRMDRSG
jgi:hypothetical protein